MDEQRVVCPECGYVNKVIKQEHYSEADCTHCKASLLQTKSIQVDEEAFDNHIWNSDLLVVVDFWAPWCSPCRKMAPDFEAAATTQPMRARFLKVNTDEQGALATRYNIRTLPSLIVFKNGYEINRITRMMSAEEIQRWTEKYIARCLAAQTKRV